MWFPKMWHFGMNRLWRGCAASFKLRNSKLYSVSSLTVKEYWSERQKLWSDCTYVQADLSLCWMHIPHCWKSHIAAHLYLADIFIWHYWLGCKNKNRQNMSLRNPVSNSVTQSAINGHTPLVCWYRYRQKTTFERRSMFQCRGKPILKEATFKGENMLPKGAFSCI